MNCPECHGEAKQTEKYKDIDIYICKECRNRFGFTTKEIEARYILGLEKAKRRAA